MAKFAGRRPDSPDCPGSNPGMGTASAFDSSNDNAGSAGRLGIASDHTNRVKQPPGYLVVQVLSSLNGKIQTIPINSDVGCNGWSGGQGVQGTPSESRVVSAYLGVRVVCFSAARHFELSVAARMLTTCRFFLLFCRVPVVSRRSPVPVVMFAATAVRCASLPCAPSAARMSCCKSESPGLESQGSSGFSGSAVSVARGVKLGFRV